MAIQATGADSENKDDKRRPEEPAMDKNKNKRSNNLLAYFLLPGIIPEIKELARGRFGYLAYLIAMIYQLVRILPKNHPYTKPDNIGKFGIRQVIAAAANNITLNRKNIDQVIVFFVVMAGLVLVVFQIISFLLFIFMGDAWAGAGVPAEGDSLFITASPQTDIAFYMVREVFGLPTMFGTLEGGRTGLHIALQSLFQFYNLAILFVAALVFLYYIIVVVGETAQTGTPFGQRFSQVYAPFRLVIAIGLLVPLNYGFNGAQYIAFYSAKLGSSLATNGWIRFNQVLQDGNPLGVPNATLIAQPNVPDVTGLMEIMSVITACKQAYEFGDNGITPGGKPPPPPPPTEVEKERIGIEAYYVIPQQNRDGKIEDVAHKIDVSSVSSNPREFFDVIFSVQKTLREQIRAVGGKGSIAIYFGHKKKNGPVSQYPGNIIPYCGEVSIPITITDQKSVNAEGAASPERIQAFYFASAMLMWARPELNSLGQRIALANTPVNNKRDICSVPLSFFYRDEQAKQNGISNIGNCTVQSYKPPREWGKVVGLFHKLVTEGLTQAVYDDLRDQVDFKIDNEVLLTGWGGAGIWYNKIAQVNGAFVTATISLPNVTRKPQVMEHILQEKGKADGAFVGCKGYEPNLADGKSVEFEHITDTYYAKVMNETWQYWRCDRSGKAANFFWDSISAIFGLNGLFNIRQEVTTTHADGNTIETTIHPLAKLSAIGKSLVESSVQNMGLAVGSSFGGGALGVLGSQLGPALESASSMFVSIATIGLSIGFLLYYILPFLPFIYFFFAVGGWVKGLFEAMVGAPLWALAHLRIDGDGIPGKSAMSGYVLIFEIFLRPILTVFGLIGGLSIFTAMATILNEVFNLVVNNITGAEITPGDGSNLGGDTELGRHLVDTFFFTIVYAIILYMMAVSSFKMITLVPNNILRWLGQNVAAFNDQAGDPAQGLAQYATIGTQQIGGKLLGATTTLGKAGGQGVGEVLNIGGFGKPKSGGSSQ